MPRICRRLVAAALLAWSVGAHSDVGEVGVVSNIKVLSDKVPDMSSLEAWRSWCIRDGMSDREKALAIWQTVVGYQVQDTPPSEYLQNEDLVLDPVKLWNVYGYSFCGVAASQVQALARYVGLPARGWTINAHVVPEIQWDGAWHVLDASLINYFVKPGTGEVASVEEIVAAVQEWLGDNPELKGNGGGLMAFQQANDWSGWRRGPYLLSTCPFYDYQGWLPARTHGWYSTMQEYDCKPFQYESGYSQGYRVNIQLRKGERLVRNWSNKGLHVGMDAGAAPGALSERVGSGILTHSPRFGDLAPGRVGNGTHVYDVPLASGGFRAGALRSDNLACTADDGKTPALHLADAAKPGTLEVRMPSSYVYLDGQVTLRAIVGQGGSIEVSLSDNNGLDWKPLARIDASGERQIPLKPLILRRYDFRLRFVIQGAGTGLDALTVACDTQHSQRPLPALTRGTNVIRFAAGAPDGTVTIEGSTNPDNRGKQLVVEDLHPVLNGVRAAQLYAERDGSEATFPVETPGEMTRLRFGSFYRCRDAKDCWEYQVSFDEGKSFRTVATAPGPFVGMGKYVEVRDVPPGTRKALVRFRAPSTHNAVCMFDMRIDADYEEPAGGFRPVKVTYVWESGGQERTDVHVCRTPEETYEVVCPAAPLMKSIALERAE